MYLRAQKGEKLVFIDGGAHRGVFSDVCLALGGICYAFEPNIYLSVPLMVETHERFFENPRDKIEPLREKIAQNHIANIFLDWI